MTMVAALQPLVGRWSTTITMLNPPELSGDVYRAIDTYRWMPGEKILIHEVEARMGGDTTNSIEIYSEANGQIVSRNFDSKGEVSDYTAAMMDGAWEVTGDTERFSSTSITSDSIEGCWQLRGEGGWKDWMTIRLQRIA